ncbi:MAG: ATPase, T2SS/T4P/T4SS family [Candidatus Hydrothermarchaeales archaeon]
MDCSKYRSDVEAINKAVGEKYRDVFVIDKKRVSELKNEIKSSLGDKVPEEAIDCFIYQVLSLGQLTPYMWDESLEEIMVIGKEQPVYVFDKETGARATDSYLDEEETRAIIERIARYSGRTVNATAPLLDGRLQDGSRVNATLSAVTPKGSTITIRKFGVEPLTVLHLLRYKTLDPKLTSFLWLAVEGLDKLPANIIIIGGTASGKTTTLNALSSFIPEDKRIVSIEDTLEISIRHKHWIPMESRPPDREGNEISMDMLLKNALRMRPDRMIVGEVRAEEALTMFTAMNTGHDGCMATIHANSARDALIRLQGHPMNVPSMMLPALDLLIAHRRYTENGKLKRIVFEVVELAGREKDTFLTNTLFSHDPRTGKLDLQLMNGRYIQELSTITNLSLKELDHEMYKRELVLELMLDYDLTQKDIHRFVQNYYKHSDKTLEELHDEIKDLKLVEEKEVKSLEEKWREKEAEL